MTFEEFKDEFDQKLAAVSDDELLIEFAKMGCDVIINNDPPTT